MSTLHMVLTDDFTNLIDFKRTLLESTVHNFTLLCQKMTELQLFKLGPNLTMLATGETAYFFNSFNSN